MSIARSMLDDRHHELAVPRNDDPLYTLGTIGSYKVVIICPRRPSSQASVIKSLSATLHEKFSSVKYCFITGVGSSIRPNVRLGDVIADVGQGELELEHVSWWKTGEWTELPKTLLAILREVKLHQTRLGSRITEHVDREKSAMSATGSISLTADQLEDFLFKANYDHVENSTTGPDGNFSRHETLRSSRSIEKPCGSCDMSQIINRLPREKRVHCGMTASSNQIIIKNALERDELGRHLPDDVLCMEQDAAGLTSALPYLLICGISDYADSHGNDSWKDHATAAAAACVREILLHMPLHAFFCHGIPGSGKSVLAAAVLDHLIEVFHPDATVKICYIFCRLDQAEQGVLGLMSSILKQMCQVEQSLPQVLQDLFDSHSKQSTKPSVDEICSAVEALVLMSSRTFIVVDALDELEPGIAQHFVSRLFSLQYQTKANIFAVSRSVYDIVRRFRDHGSIIMEHRAREDDINRYVENNMDQMPNFVHANPVLQDKLKIEIVKLTNGMFLYTEHLIESVRGCTTNRSMLRYLDTIMRRIQKQDADHTDLAIHILIWAEVTRGSLTIKALQHALANIPDEASILSRIGFCHLSVRECFRAQKSKWFPDARLHIAKTCLTYVSFDTFNSGMAQGKEEYNDRLLLNPFFEYASTGWGLYARVEADLIDSLHFLVKEQNVAAAAQVYFQRIPQITLSEFAAFKQPVGLHLAACFGLIEAATFLLGTYDLAVISGHENMVELLIHKHADIESKDSRGRTALSLAVKWGRVSIVDLLVKHGAKVNFYDEDGHSPLLQAIEANNEDIAQLLLEHGADIETEDSGWRT
ncbi:hypothetical protein BBK36DRAFT_1168784 [Trichoderma citrinoviride]|uniref:Nephrocystin 3-like N-terminal domain-containing protein n=1 Tax=Trichoderma citrinoviride TaxID=58853 RepID=A0A2T4BAB9_9HYPO|nr:hypothetical protein BBK36DRAFT_1168784 [Trichoderma citrinoviride]PTB66159.1 hypothetical protein BBK36DRAFT_1168784 [Trichoderma citrinoviride]